MGFPKMSMLAFYWAYFLPSTGMSSVMRKSLYGITAFVCISYMVILWDDTFFCGKDVSVQWSLEEGACSVFYAPEPFILNFTLNLACYLAGMILSKRFSLFISANHSSLVYALPLILLLQGVLHHSKGVTLTFVLGAMTICTTMVRFICLKVGTGQENLVCKTILPFIITQSLMYCFADPLSMLEMTLAIIVVSLPGLKPLIDRAPKHQSSSEIVEMKN
jgi:hypothetical protein